MATITDEVVVKIKIAKEKAGAALKVIKEQFKGLGATIAKQAKRAAVALAGLTAALGAMIVSTAKTGDEIAKMSKRLNISTEDLSALRFQAGLAGTDFRAAATGIRFMTKAMFDSTQGLETAQRGFDILGITVTKTDGKLKDAQDIFLEISDALADMEDGTEKTAAAQLLFGSRMGTQLIPLLNQGSDALREQAEEARKLGIVFDEEAARKSEILVDSMLRFNKVIEGVRNEIAFELIPKVSKYLTILKDWILANKQLIAQNVQLTIRLIAEALISLRDGAVAVAEVVKENRELIKTLSSMAVGFAAVSLAMSIATGNLLGGLASLALLKGAFAGLGLALAVEKMQEFSKEIKSAKQNIADSLVPMHTMSTNLGLVSTHSSASAKAMAKIKELIKAFPEAFKTAGEKGKEAAEKIQSAWEKTSDTVKKAFEALGIVPKAQFESQVKEIAKNFELVAKSGKLSNDDVVKARAKMFEDLQALADKAKEEGVLGVDIEAFKTELDEVQQDLINKTTDATRTLKDATGQDVTELFKEFEVNWTNASEIMLKGFTQNSATIADEAAKGIGGLFKDTTKAQQEAFDKIKDEVERLAEFQFKIEDDITANLKTETAERLQIIKDFVFDAEAEFIRLSTFQRGQRGGIAPPATESDLPFFVGEGFAKGINRVPFDMIAPIHKDERIIPANQNRQNLVNHNNNQQFIFNNNGNGNNGVIEQFAAQRFFEQMALATRL